MTQLGASTNKEAVVTKRAGALIAFLIAGKAPQIEGTLKGLELGRRKVARHDFMLQLVLVED